MVVNVTAVRALKNPSKFMDPLEFEIEYEALVNLKADLAWKLTYVGSADSDRYDQVLEDVEVGPVSQGTFKFILQANPPNPELIPPDDIVGVTVIMLTCSYREKEFIRVGYYVNNEYDCDDLRKEPPAQPQIYLLQRSILIDHPRVTRYAISFDEAEPESGIQPMDEAGPMAMDDVLQAHAGVQGDTAPMMLQQLPPGYTDAQQGMFNGYESTQQTPQQAFQGVPVQ